MFSKKNQTIDEEYVSGEITKIDGDDVDVVMENEEEISDKLSSANFLKKYGALSSFTFTKARTVDSNKKAETEAILLQ